MIQVKLEKSDIMRMNGADTADDGREAALCLRKASIKKS
jgi:hypothetical protein